MDRTRFYLNFAATFLCALGFACVFLAAWVML